MAGVTAAATAAVAQPQQKVTGPVAVYWMSAATQSGFGMPGMGGGGGRPSAMDIMRMATGGGGGANHSLMLELGSSQRPQGEPQADHFPPTGLGLGSSVPLVSPEKATPVREEPDRPEIPHEYQRPKGKMLIFWGCGEHAKPGQPVVIDFSQITPEKISAGQMPAGFEVFEHMITSRMQPPSARFPTYGDWPNSKSRVAVTGQSSLVGEHTIKGDYNPELKFSLNQNQDFLGPLNLTTNAKLPSGAVQLGWNTVPGAEAYVASFIGASPGGRGDDGTTMVMWISSETEAIGFAVPEYISNPEIARLVKTKTLMGPEATACQVPKEAVDAGRQGLVQMVAYGHEANFAYPERPKDPKIPWNIAWEVKVRYRSATGGLLGQPMPGGMGGRSGYAAGAQQG
ncbi:MAG: hypothetical protein JSS35_04675, partial [Proteobacteria bacterium]|nr:hypothetical protein [Pseudomonadota bacterium]